MVTHVGIGELLSALMTILVVSSAGFFIVIYTVLARWWKTSIGKALVVMDAGLMLVLFPEILHHLFALREDSGPLSWFSAVSLMIIFIAISWRTAILVRDQTHRQENENDQDDVGQHQSRRDPP